MHLHLQNRQEEHVKSESEDIVLIKEQKSHRS